MTYAGPGQAERTVSGSATFVNDLLGIGVRTQSGSSDNYTRDPSGRPLAQKTSSGNSYFMFDGLGSVIGFTDSTGNVSGTYSYDPYGNQLSAEPAVFNPWRYADYYWSTTYNLYKAGERYYDPSIGRWAQRDPVEDALDGHGWNQYLYASDDPVNFVDPTGELGIGDVTGALQKLGSAAGTAARAVGGVAGTAARATGAALVRAGSATASATRAAYTSVVNRMVSGRLTAGRLGIAGLAFGGCATSAYGAYQAKSASATALYSGLAAVSCGLGILALTG